MARLANSLGYELVKTEAEKDARSKSPDAVDLTMRGWALVWQEQQQQRTKENNNAAQALFEQALKIDPNEPDALAGEAYTYFLDTRADGQPPGPITRQRYSVRPTGPSRSPPIMCGRIM